MAEWQNGRMDFSRRRAYSGFAKALGKRRVIKVSSSAKLSALDVRSRAVGDGSNRSGANERQSGDMQPVSFGDIDRYLSAGAYDR